MKSLTKVHFSTRVPREGVPIAHVLTPTLLASDAVAVIDTSDKIPQNTFFEKEIQIDLSDGILNYYLDKRGFMLTDQFKGTRPLYFLHKIQQPIFLDAQGQTDIVVVDENGIAQNDAFYLFDCAQKVIYHALDPRGVYFVIYPRVDASNNIVERRHKELLEAVPAFHEALPVDLDKDGCILADSNGYILEEQDGQPLFWRISLPRPTKYALQYTTDGLLKIHLPRTEQNEPWFVEIQNTVLLTKQTVSHTLLRYSVAEFPVQNFYPFPPIRMVADKNAVVVAPGVVDVGARRLVQTTKTPVDVKIFAADGTLSQAITTDENRLGHMINRVYWEVGLIESIDNYNGRLSLRRDIRPGEIIKVSFYHEADTYQYTGYNFNPLYNPDALVQHVAILVRPDFLGCRSTISHVTFDSDNNILEASDPDIANWDDGTKIWDDLKADWLYIPGEDTDNQNNYLLLGLVTVTNPLAPEQATIQDARRRGGGIDDRLIRQALGIEPSACQNWDIGFWDGPHEPVQGAIALYLPDLIRNIFTEDEIRSRISKFAPAGSFFVIRYF